MKVLFSLFTFFLCAYSAHAVISLDGSVGWVAIEYDTRSDYVNDQGTGQGSSDIVGSANADDPYYSGFQKAYDDGGTSGDINDDSIAFRVRFAEKESANKETYTKYVIFGIDVGGDGAVDLFMSANSQGIKFFSTGSGLNVSPNTTTTSELSAYANTVGGSNTLPTSLVTYLAVDATTEATTPVNNDLDGGSDTDYFFSVKFSMSDIIAAYEDSYAISNPGDPIPELGLTTSLGFLVGTSTQDNAYNQDFGGIDGGVDKNDTTTWTDLGVSSNPYTPNGTEPVPEPATYALLFGFFAIGFSAVRRRR